MINGLNVVRMSRVLVVCGPSGSGKSTLVERLLSCQELSADVGRAVTHTTRAPRPGERNAVDYHFVTEEQMRSLVAGGEMIESARFSGNLYGTSKKAVADVVRSGRLCVVIMDVQGVEAVRNGDETLKPSFVFVRPPSLETLRERLLARGSESEADVDRRMKIAAEEMAYGERAGHFDLTIVNDDLSEAFERLKQFTEQLIRTFKTA
jgi:guanylate kinase